MTFENLVNLGNTGIMVSKVGLGVLQWGEIQISRSDKEINEVIRDIFQASLNGGINFFDSAETYGNGRSEVHLGRCINTSPKDIIIATKFMPYPWRLSKNELRSALLRSLKRLGVSHVDLYQMHWPTPPVPIKSWMDAMSEAISDGLVRAVGVSNYSASQTRQAYEALARHNIPLASNQVKYNLLDRRPERNGLIELCNKLNISIIAYSPLQKGILSGKYSPDNLPSGYRAWRYNRGYLIKIKPLLDELRNIGGVHDGKTPVQVALNWLICKGAIPIPGVRTAKQAEENAGGLGWQLSVEEVARLDMISDLVMR